MRLVWHIAAKDLRRFAWPVAGWVMFIIATTLWFGLRWFGGQAEGAADQLNVLRNWGAVVLGLQLIVGYILAGAMLLEDSVGDASAWWRTRPIGRGRLLLTKLLATGAAFVLMPAVVLALASWAAGFSGVQAGRGAAEFMFWQLWVTVPALAVAALARDLRGFLLWTVVIAAAYVVCTAYIFTAWLVEPLDFALRRSRGFIVQMALVPGAAAVLLHQFLGRAARRTWLGIGVGLLVLLSVRVAWPWNIWPVYQAIFGSGWGTSGAAAAVAVQRMPDNRSLIVRETPAVSAGGVFLAPLTGVAGGGERCFPGPSWGGDAARALYRKTSDAASCRWEMTFERDVVPTTPALKDTSGARVQGALLVAELQGHVLGEVPLVAGAMISEAAVRTRLTGLVRDDRGAAAVVEEHEPVEAWKGESPDAQGNFARFASARNVYLLVHRASGVVRVAPATEIGEVVLNGFAVRFRRLDLGDAPEDAVLVQVRFVVLRVQAQPFATAPEKGRATGDTP